MYHPHKHKEMVDVRKVFQRSGSIKRIVGSLIDVLNIVFERDRQFGIINSSLWRIFFLCGMLFSKLFVT